MKKKTRSSRFEQIRGKVPKKSPKRTKRDERPAFQRRKENWPANMYQYASGGRYFFERQYEGRRIKESLGKSERAAMKRAIELNESIDRGDYKPKSQSGRKVTFGELVELALDEKSDRAPKTIQSYRGKSQHFMEYLDERHSSVTYIKDVTPEIASGYVDWRNNRRVTRCGWRTDTTPTAKPSPKTVRHDLSRLRSIFKLTVDRGWLNVNPFDNVRLPKQPGERRSAHNPLSDTDVRKVLRAAQQYDSSGDVRSTFRGMMHDMTRLFLLTGMRLNELIHLPWRHVDLDWGEHGIIDIRDFDLPVTLYIHVSDAGALKLDRARDQLRGSERIFRSQQQMRVIIPTGYVKQCTADLLKVKARDWESTEQILKVKTRIAWNPKASHGRIPLVPESRKVLIRRRKRNTAKSAFVFPHPDRGPLRSSYWQEFQTLLRLGKIRTRYRVHDLRHTFGMRLRRAGVPLETIMGLMRHADIKETMIYAQYSDEEGAEQIQKLSLALANGRR